MRELKFKKIYDLALDLMNIFTESDFVYSKTVEVEYGLYIDFDENGCPIAIELINFSKRFKVVRQFLLDAKVTGLIEVNIDLIKIKLNIRINKEFRTVESEISNDFGISSGKYDILIE